MRKVLFIILLLGFTLIASQTRANAQRDTLKILFVGNSFTSFFNLPQVVSGMANASGHFMLTRRSTVGGTNLEQHWKGEKGTETMALLEKEKWDYVVFNNHSRSAYATPQSFMQYGKLFADKVKSLGAEPVFLVTWAYKSNPLMQDKITEGYMRLAEESGAALVPAGPLFKRARELRPDLNLFHDNKHQSSIGCYLIALAFYKYFMNESVIDVTTAPSIPDINGENVQLIFIGRNTAIFLKQLVDEFNW